MRLKTLFSIAIILLALPLAAQVEADSYGAITGWVQFSDNTPAVGATVMVCSGPYYCATTLTLYPDGRYQFPDGTYPTYGGNLSVYAWMDNPPGRTGRWGSDHDAYVSNLPPCNNLDQFGFCAGTGYSISPYLYPQPLQPQPFQPANGAIDVPLTGLQISWADGMDTARRQFHDTLGYPYSANLTYDIYASGCCIPPQLYASSVPCNGSNGTCYFNVPSTLVPGSVYSWYVKAKYHVPIYGVNANLTNQSYTSGFTTTGAAPKYSFRTYYSFYISATNCGGSTLYTPTQSIGSCEKFTIQDSNGGELLNGDPIYIQANNGSFWSAVNGGGGAVNANAAYPGPWEAFRIWKMNNNGQGPIVSGDNVTITCSNGQYVVAEGGGYNNTVNCNRTTAAQWETFGVNTFSY